MKRTITFFLPLILLLSQFAVAQVDESFASVSELTTHSDISVSSLLLAENSEGSDRTEGELVVPTTSDGQAKEKQCVTVCDKWGKDCIINPRTGVRKCRRMCKAFAKECM